MGLISTSSGVYEDYDPSRRQRRSEYLAQRMEDRLINEDRMIREEAYRRQRALDFEAYRRQRSVEDMEAYRRQRSVEDMEAYRDMSVNCLVMKPTYSKTHCNDCRGEPTSLKSCCGSYCQQVGVVSKLGNYFDTHDGP